MSLNNLNSTQVTFLLLSMLKTVVLFNSFVKTVIHFQDSLMHRKFKIQHLFDSSYFKVFALTLDQFNAFLLHTSICINIFKQQKKFNLISYISYLHTFM